MQREREREARGVSVGVERSAEEPGKEQLLRLLKALPALTIHVHVSRRYAKRACAFNVLRLRCKMPTHPRLHFDFDWRRCFNVPAQFQLDPMMPAWTNPNPHMWTD